MVRLVKQATARPRQSTFNPRVKTQTTVKVEDNGNVIIDLNDLSKVDETTKQKMLSDARGKINVLIKKYEDKADDARAKSKEYKAKGKDDKYDDYQDKKRQYEARADAYKDALAKTSDALIKDYYSGYTDNYAKFKYKEERAYQRDKDKDIAAAKKYYEDISKDRPDLKISVDKDYKITGVTSDELKQSFVNVDAFNVAVDKANERTTVKAPVRVNKFDQYYNPTNVNPLLKNVAQSRDPSSQMSSGVRTYPGIDLEKGSNVTQAVAEAARSTRVTQNVSGVKTYSPTELMTLDSGSDRNSRASKVNDFFEYVNPLSSRFGQLNPKKQYSRPADSFDSRQDPVAAVSNARNKNSATIKNTGVKLYKANELAFLDFGGFTPIEKFTSKRKEFFSQLNPVAFQKTKFQEGETPPTDVFTTLGLTAPGSGAKSSSQLYSQDYDRQRLVYKFGQVQNTLEGLNQAYNSGYMTYDTYKNQFEGITNNVSYKKLAKDAKQYLDAKTFNKLISDKLKDKPGAQVVAGGLLFGANIVKYSNPFLLGGEVVTMVESGATRTGEGILEKDKSKIRAGIAEGAIAGFIGSTMLPNVQATILSIGGKIPKIAKVPLALGGVGLIGGGAGISAYQETESLPFAIGAGLGSVSAIVGMGVYAKVQSKNVNKEISKEFKKLSEAKGISEPIVQKVGEDKWDVISIYTKKTAKLNQETKTFVKIVKKGGKYFIDSGNVYSIVTDKSGKEVSSSVNDIFTGQLTPGSRIARIQIKDNQMIEYALKNGNINIGRVTIIDNNGVMKDINFANLLNKNTKEYSRVLSTKLSDYYTRTTADIKVSRDSDGLTIEAPFWKTYTGVKTKFTPKDVATVTTGDTSSYSVLSLQNADTKNLLKQFTVGQVAAKTKIIKTPWNYADNLLAGNIAPTPKVFTSPSKSSSGISSYFNTGYGQSGGSQVLMQQPVDINQVATSSQVLTNPDAIPALTLGFESSIIPAAPVVQANLVPSLFPTATANLLGSTYNVKPVSNLDSMSEVMSLSNSVSNQPSKVKIKTKTLAKQNFNVNQIFSQSLNLNQLSGQVQLSQQKSKIKQAQKQAQRKAPPVPVPITPFGFGFEVTPPPVIPGFGFPEFDKKKKKKLEEERKRRLAEAQKRSALPTLFQSQILGEQKARRKSGRTGFELIR